jgi:hypothetical protein
MVPKKVTYGDQQRYILSRLKQPEDFANIKDQLSAIGDAARMEREQAHEESAQFQHENDQYNQNVREDARLRFDTWKALQDKKDAGHKLRSEELAAARARRDVLAKQLSDVRSFQARIGHTMGGGKNAEPIEVLQAAYPEFFTQKSEGPGTLATLLQGESAKPELVTKFDPQKMTEHVRGIQAELESIDRVLSEKSGTDNVTELPNTIPDLSKYLKPRKK